MYLNNMWSLICLSTPYGFLEAIFFHYLLCFSETCICNRTCYRCRKQFGLNQDAPVSGVHNFRTPFSMDPFLIHERLFNYWGRLYVKVTIPSKVRVRRNASGYLMYWHDVVLSFSEYEYPILHLLHLNANILGHEPNICHF